jgi:hypothetical protein
VTPGCAQRGASLGHLRKHGDESVPRSFGALFCCGVVSMKLGQPRKHATDG